MLIASSQELNIPLNYSKQIHFISASYLLADLPTRTPVRLYDDNAALISHAYNIDVLVNEWVNQILQYLFSSCSILFCVYYKKKYLFVLPCLFHEREIEFCKYMWFNAWILVKYMKFLSYMKYACVLWKTKWKFLQNYCLPRVFHIFSFSGCINFTTKFSFIYSIQLNLQ